MAVSILHLFQSNKFGEEGPRLPTFLIKCSQCEFIVVYYVVNAVAQCSNVVTFIVKRLDTISHSQKCPFKRVLNKFEINAVVQCSASEVQIISKCQAVSNTALVILGTSQSSYHLMTM